MNAQTIRQKYLEFFSERGHAVIPRALLVPQDDATTLFTGSGMQPLVPYLLGEPHPKGTRLVDSQTCLRAQDIDEVGDNRHTTFFEMLGNWSLGDYFKQEQIGWVWEFVTEQIGLDPDRIFVTCFSGDDASGIPKDTESAAVWGRLFREKGIDAKEVEIGSEENGYKVGDQGGRIFFYGDKNWWCRAGKASNMPVGEPGGPDTEMFYLYPDVEHDSSWGEKCHVNCDCGRYIELGNSVFMEYMKTESGFEKLPKQNVDYGGGLERIAAASIDSPDVYKISVLWPIIEALQTLSGKTYGGHTESMRVIADHLRGAIFLAVDGVVPSNKEQGYVMRRLMRRAILKAFHLGIEQNFIQEIAPVISSLYRDDFPELARNEEQVIQILTKEEKAFKQTLRKGIKELERMLTAQKSEDTDGPSEAFKRSITGKEVFKLYDTHGFPMELSIEEATKRGIVPHEGWRDQFEACMQEQKQKSQTAAKGAFAGGLGGHDDIHKKYHTATHLMYKALRMVLGDHVIQRGSNITAERLRFDFTHPEKVSPEQITEIEKMVNEQIAKQWPMSWHETNTKEALSAGVLGAFGDTYGETVKVYTAGDPNGDWFSKEICGGPHVDNTRELAENDKQFEIIKEEASSAGIRRIKAVLR